MPMAAADSGNPDRCTAHRPELYKLSSLQFLTLLFKWNIIYKYKLKLEFVSVLKNLIHHTGFQSQIIINGITNRPIYPVLVKPARSYAGIFHYTQKNKTHPFELFSDLSEY